MKRYCIVIVVLSCILLTACKANETNSNNQLSPSPPAGNEPTITNTPPEVTITPEPSPIIDVSQQKKVELETSINEVESQQNIEEILLEAIPLFCENLSFDLGKVELSNDILKYIVQNAYHNVLSQEPTLKFAYEIQVKFNEDSKIAECTFKYMPYKLGFDGSEVPQNAQQVYTLKDLISLAQDNLAETSVDIIIMNPMLDVEDMQNALQQVGYSYILCSLNQDSTQIIMSPEGGSTREECLGYIEETNRLADGILNDIITDSMTDEEKILAAYSYVTENTVYDQRYYSNLDEMPYKSMTAYGALKDNLAICGGYSWAVRLLMDKLGIECYNVSGSSRGENHMWNVIKYEGEYLYFDATYDRGVTPELGFANFAMTKERVAQGRKWNDAFFQHFLVEE